MLDQPQPNPALGCFALILGLPLMLAAAMYAMILWYALVDTVRGWFGLDDREASDV